MSNCVYLGRPEQPFRTGLCSAADVFLDSHISEAPRPIGAKLCHMIEIWLESPNKVGQLGGPPLKNFRGQKRAKFRSIFCNVRLWPRISPEWLKISKPKRDVFYIDSSCVQRNRTGELWSTNSRDLAVRLDPVKCTFWGYYISALRGCCALKFLHALEIDQGYLAHTPTGPPKKF